MSTSKAKSVAKATGKLALAATVAALMDGGRTHRARLPGYPISAARATAPYKRAAPSREWGYCVSGLHDPARPRRVSAA